jgi:hypothetical protein
MPAIAAVGRASELLDVDWAVSAWLLSLGAGVLDPTTVFDGLLVGLTKTDELLLNGPPVELALMLIVLVGMLLLLDTPTMLYGPPTALFSLPLVTLSWI